MILGHFKTSSKDNDTYVGVARAFWLGGGAKVICPSSSRASIYIHVVYINIDSELQVDLLMILSGIGGL